jgi:hypothetical protein
VSHLWLQDSAGEWSTLSLDQEVVPMTKPDPGAADAPALIWRREDDAGECWVLLACDEADARVNGLPLVGGLRVLADRDEIQITGGPACFFSTERPAEVVSFDREADPSCPRCTQRIERKTGAVQCPSCGVWHHQSDRLPCWTYAPHCAICDQPTELDAGFRWTPEGL